MKKTAVIFTFLFSLFVSQITLAQYTNLTPEQISEKIKKAEEGDASAQLHVGLMYANGEGVKQNYMQAAKYFQLSADQGEPHAQYNLGTMYFYGLGGLTLDHVQAAKYVKLSADQGDSEAQYFLATLYYYGFADLTVDYVQAAKYYQLSADQGDPAAQLLLGFMYYRGKGLRQSDSTAKEWFGKACDNGLQDGCDKYKELN